MTIVVAGLIVVRVGTNESGRPVFQLYRPFGSESKVYVLAEEVPGNEPMALLEACVLAERYGEASNR